MSPGSMGSSKTSGPRVTDEKTKTRFKAMDHIRELQTRWSNEVWEQGPERLPEAMGYGRYKTFLGWLGSSTRLKKEQWGAQFFKQRNESLCLKTQWKWVYKECGETSGRQEKQDDKYLRISYIFISFILYYKYKHML